MAGNLTEIIEQQPRIKSSQQVQETMSKVRSWSHYGQPPILDASETNTTKRKADFKYK